MPTFDFTSPDGKTYSMQGPDGATTEQAFQLLQQNLGSAQAQPQTQDQAPPPTSSAQPQTSTLADIGKSALSGLETGITGLAGIPGDIRSGLSAATSYLGDKLGYTPTQIDNFKNMASAAYGGFSALPTAQDVQSKVNNVTGTTPYQPQTTAGEYARTIGQFAPAALGGPGSLPARIATQVVAPAVASETAGQAARAISPESEPYARIAGAVTAPAALNTASRVISPTTVNPARADAVNTLQNAGVTALTAGQKSGSRALQYTESELGDATFAGNKATKANELAHQQFTQAVLKRAGIDAPRATPEVIDQAFTTNGNAFDSIAARNPAIPVTPAFWNEVKGIADEYKNMTNQESPLINNLLDRLKGGAPSTVTFPPKYQNIVNQLRSQGVSDADIATTLGVKPMPSGAPQAITGDAYQSVRSDIVKALPKTSQSELRGALYDLRNAIDQGVANGLKQANNPQDYAAWQQARQQYKNLLVVQKAIGNDTEKAATGLITPAKLGQAARSVSGQRAFVRGRGDYADLARAGNAVMKDLPQSGTTPRAMAHAGPAAIGTLLGLGGGHLGGEHIAGAIVGAATPAILGRAIMSPLGQAYLSNQLATGLRNGRVVPNALTGGLLSLPSAQQQKQIP